MKDIKTAKFIKEFCALTSNMYRLGWDERNGGNVSVMLETAEVEQYLDPTDVKRTFTITFDASYLKGKYFLVTGTGKYFKNVENDPENNIGIIRVGEDGKTMEIMWGYEDGSRPTSELPAHFMSHIERLKVDPEHRDIISTQTVNGVKYVMIRVTGGVEVNGININIEE